MAKDLLATLLVLPRTKLLEADLGTGPGLYCHWIGSTRLVELLGVAALGEVPAYIGSTGIGLHQRHGRHKINLAGLGGVDLSEIWVSALPCASRASALFSEAMALDRLLQPPLNALGGWGNMNPGRRRSGQTASGVDSLFAPGRSWARPPSLTDQIRARCQMLAALARIDPAGPRWPKLVTEPGPAGSEEAGS